MNFRARSIAAATPVVSRRRRPSVDSGGACQKIAQGRDPHTAVARGLQYRIDPVRPHRYAYVRVVQLSLFACRGSDRSGHFRCFSDLKQQISRVQTRGVSGAGKATNSLIHNRVRKRRENCRKKVPELFGSCLEKSLSLHPLRERNTARKRQKQVLKNFGKSSEILWRFRKMTYLCTRFECNTRFEAIRKKVLKKF